MTTEYPRRASRVWWVIGIAGISLIVLASFSFLRARRNQSTLIHIDSNGTTRLGPLPLRNTNLRDAAFTAMGHLGSGTASVSAAKSAKFSDVAATVGAMRQAGITSVTIRATE